MKTGIGVYFLNYLLMPVIFLILGLVSVIIAKKNQLLSDKKAVMYVLLSSLFLSIWGLTGLFGPLFLPYTYLALQFVFLFMGWVDYKLLHFFIKPLESKSIWVTILVMIFQLMLAWAIFAVLFNVTNELQYGLWAGTSLFTILFVPMFSLLYQSYLQIPAEIYKMHVYRLSDSFEPPQTEIDVTKLGVYEIEVPRFVEDKVPIRIKAKALNSFVFAEWFGMIVTDYNQKKVEDQVEINDKEESYGWIFYTEGLFMKSRRYLNPDDTFEQNKLSGDELIIAKRVKKVE